MPGLKNAPDNRRVFRQRTMTAFSPIAVVGLSGVFPGAPDTDHFWDNILHKRSAIDKVPPERWIADPGRVVAAGAHPDKAFTRRAGLVCNFRLDTAGFRLLPGEIAALDPMHHLVLHAGREALRQVRSFDSAGTKPHGRTGVILAAIALPTDSASAWTRMLFSTAAKAAVFKEAPAAPIDIDQARIMAQAAQVTGYPAALLARALGLGGGAYTLDAACASSLYAISLACDALHAGRTDVMLAGGVSRPECLYTQIGFSQLQALSPTGHCAPFDRDANGLVVGEGVGILVLKRLDDAVRDGDTITGVIRGIGLSNDVGGNLLAPLSPGQVAAMRQAYAQAGWSPRDVQMIECHGAGTPVGDQIELGSLATLWHDVSGTGTSPCRLGSIKSMIGHTLTAAGAAGAIKMLLALRHRQLPPSLNFQNPPAGSVLETGPFRVQTEAEPWTPRKSTPRRAAVSAFGFGGINAHLLLEAHHPRPTRRPAAAKRPPAPAVAVVGMACAFGTATDRDAFETAVFQNRPAFRKRPPHRWKGCDSAAQCLVDVSQADVGAYMDTVSVPLGAYQIPPNALSDVSPQHLLMLNMARDAMADAGLDVGPERPAMGALIGIGFDADATDFHFRWAVPELVEKWRRENKLANSTDGPEMDRWLNALQNAAAPPLTSTRTIGNLGSMVASRIAKSFRFGAPSFVVSAGEAAGTTALEIAVRLIQTGRAETMLVGAVDMAGDVRTLLAQWMRSGGLPPGEGAVALVLKPADQAMEDGNRIYGVIRGIATACGTNSAAGRAIRQCMSEASATTPDPGAAVGYVEICLPQSAAKPAAVLSDLFPKPTRMSRLSPLIGHPVAAAGLAGIAKACLCLHRKVLPPADTPESGAGDGPCSWPAATGDVPRRALCVCQSTDGIASGILMEAAEICGTVKTAPPQTRSKIALRTLGGIMPFPQAPPAQETHAPETDSANTSRPETEPRVPPAASASPSSLRRMEDPFAATARAHARFLEFSQTMQHAYRDLVRGQLALLSGGYSTAPAAAAPTAPAMKPLPGHPAFTREQCMTFAVGAVGDVFGPDFAVVDTFPARVRLPDAPLMLVDRVLSITAEKGVLGAGRVITEHDVLPEAWYLDGGRAPSCISVEAGQADLFLCAYMGIDLRVRGKRTYRLLDATVDFFRSLPRPGEVIRYDIRIEKFMRQGDTYLFFFRFDGTIDGAPLIRMRNGCAGFFTEEEVRNSGGILDTDTGSAPMEPDDALGADWQPPVPLAQAAYNADQLDALRRGDLAACFGAAFAGVQAAAALTLPGGRMRLIDRVSSLTPNGGPYGRGLIRAEADIDPAAWFLTCHFVDDPVMPGTLMYECCMHTLRVLLMRMGWVTDNPDACWEPKPGVHSRLKCRGPVTPRTRKVVYEVAVKSLGYDPEPYAVADAHMYADGQRIVYFENMSLKLSGTDRNGIEAFWRRHRTQRSALDTAPAPVFNHRQVLAFAEGNPSEAFGPAYAPFDRDRFIARLPRPPYSFLTHVTAAEPPPWVLAPGGWITAEYAVPPNAWYFHADRNAAIPYAILLEIALQPCGWLAAWAGSALKSSRDLRFRNLGGKATLHAAPRAAGETVTVRARMTKVSTAADMIIEHFDFQVRLRDRMLFEGSTHFGFFTPDALSRQAGLTPVAADLGCAPQDSLPRGEGSWKLPEDLPHAPWIDAPPDPAAAGMPLDAIAAGRQGLCLPAKALRMIDAVDIWQPQGGIAGLGYARAVQQVDPDAWFFRAHFHQDPVCPGSLGIESLLQLMKWIAREKWPEYRHSHIFELMCGRPHQWSYRGQITPGNQQITVAATVTAIDDGPAPVLWANGVLTVDGLPIYRMDHFGLRITAAHQPGNPVPRPDAVRPPADAGSTEPTERTL